MEQRVASLTEELHSTHEDLLTVRRENVTRLSQMQRDIDEKNDTVRQLVRFIKKYTRSLSLSFWLEIKIHFSLFMAFDKLL
jgi:hypothetical protein